jgi:hypothetical protein
MPEADPDGGNRPGPQMDRLTERLAASVSCEKFGSMARGFQESAAYAATCTPPVTDFHTRWIAPQVRSLGRGAERVVAAVKLPDPDVWLDQCRD